MSDNDHNHDVDDDDFARQLRRLSRRPDRALEPWELTDYRTYWPKLKRMAIAWDAFSSSIRILAVIGGVFVAMYGVRDFISGIVIAFVKSFGGHG